MQTHCTATKHDYQQLGNERNLGVRSHDTPEQHQCVKILGGRGGMLELDPFSVIPVTLNFRADEQHRDLLVDAPDDRIDIAIQRL